MVNLRCWRPIWSFLSPTRWSFVSTDNSKKIVLGHGNRVVQVHQNLDKRLEWHVVMVEIWRKCGKNHKKCDFSNLRRNWATLKESPFFQSSICHNSRPLKLKIHKVKKQNLKNQFYGSTFSSIKISLKIHISPKSCILPKNWDGLYFRWLHLSQYHYVFTSIL